ncbi:condensation domain-containing protein, partial [Streptomyces sp. NPDC050546]|uniref:condensation domain-containing protein n=1 Tax=Streptomyces sp. NPDC050546 TaxID=3365628 RepID=UPI0037ACF4CE
MTLEAPRDRVLAGLTPEQRARLALELARRKTAGTSPVTRQPRTPGTENLFPASPGQERLWYLHALEPDSTAYVLPIVLRLRGPLDVPALETALGTIVDRHEVLRTVFREAEDGTVRQVVLSALPVSLPVTELAGARHELWRQVRTEAARPFDLSEGPLLRGSLLRVGVDEWVLVLCVHHIVVDGWSLGVLVEELGEAYAAGVEGRPARLAGLPVQYADFAVWQREWLSGERLERQLAYWREHLDSAPVLDVPGDRPRPAVSSFAGDSVPLDLDPELVGGLTRLVEGESATLFMGLLAGFASVLGRWAGQRDVVVGTAVAGRTRTELEPLVGFFVNTLALRVDVGGGASFREVLGRARRAALDGFAHQDVPFERVVQELGTDRRAGNPPVAQCMLALRNVPMRPPRLGELDVEVVEIPRDVAQLDLSVELVPTAEGGLSGALEFSTELFDRGSAERLVEGVVSLLCGAVAAPDVPVGSLSVLGEGQRGLLEGF